MNDPSFEHGLYIRWENQQTRRYYEARLLKNLFNEWEVYCVWGGIGTRLGGSSVIPAVSLEEAQATLAKINSRRIKRHYLPVGSL